MKYGLATGLALLLVGVFASLVVSAGNARAAGSSITLTGNQMAVVDGGAMTLHAYDHSSAPFAIQDSNNGPDFTVTKSAMSGTSVGAAPVLAVGCGVGHTCPGHGPFPLALSSLRAGELTSSVTSITPSSATGRWLHFYDIFLTARPGQAVGTAPREELEIFQNGHDRWAISSQLVATGVRLDGRLWDVYEGHPNVPSTVTYAPETRGDFSGDLLPFFQDSIKRGYAKANWYVDQIRNGYEISGGNDVGLGVSNFSVHVGGASAALTGSTAPTTTTASPTATAVPSVSSAPVNTPMNNTPVRVSSS